jgi:pSer/pThr/pTyr-binding forkhead associated (FHA) protein
VGEHDGDQVEFPLVSSPMFVGRDETAGIWVDEPLVSRAHARIELRGNTYAVCDLGFTNLTRVNGEVAAEPELRQGDEIRFALARCVFLADGETIPSPMVCHRDFTVVGPRTS